jgi:DNA-binding PadR family transcriptional regulator
VLELAILGFLTEQELHGYELKKRLVDTLGVGSGVSFGSLYPALARLERAGAVKAVEAREAAAPVPLTGSLGGEIAAYRARRSPVRGTRGKKVYGITPHGSQLFEELLAADAESGDDDRLFNLRLVFARHLHPDARLGMLERRRIQLLDRLTRIRTRVRAGVDRLDAYGRSLVEHDREATEHDISWIEQLIARERAAAPQPATPQLAAPQPAATLLSGFAPDTPQATEFPPPSAPKRADRPSLSGLHGAVPAQAVPRQEDNPL